MNVLFILSDGSEVMLDSEVELSLWTWWKEVVFISIFTALMMNLLITQPAVNRIRENFRVALERISRRHPVRIILFGSKTRLRPAVVAEWSKSLCNICQLMNGTYWTQVHF